MWYQYQGFGYLASENLGTFRCMIMLRNTGCKVAVCESLCDRVCVQTSNVCCAHTHVPTLCT